MLAVPANDDGIRVSETKSGKLFQAVLLSGSGDCPCHQRLEQPPLIQSRLRHKRKTSGLRKRFHDPTQAHQKVYVKAWEVQGPCLAARRNLYACVWLQIRGTPRTPAEVRQSGAESRVLYFDAEDLLLGLRQYHAGGVIQRPARDSPRIVQCME